MKHKNRKRCVANERRREQAEAKQRPLPVEEQRKRAAERLAAHRRRYPVPPVYRDDNGPPVTQPLCYQRVRY